MNLLWRGVVLTTMLVWAYVLGIIGLFCMLEWSSRAPGPTHAEFLGPGLPMVLGPLLIAASQFVFALMMSRLLSRVPARLSAAFEFVPWLIAMGVVIGLVL